MYFKLWLLQNRLWPAGPQDNTVPQKVFRTKYFMSIFSGDGNCLLHAVSLFMWGVHDSMLLLRRLLYIALVQDTGQTRARWRKERGFLDQDIPEGCQLNSAVR